jgi:hypothetical protein
MPVNVKCVKVSMVERKKSVDEILGCNTALRNVLPYGIFYIGIML